MGDNVTVSGGSGMGTLFLVFLILKLTGTIAWSWWWVTAPLWMPFCIVMGSVVAVGILTLIGFSITTIFDWMMKGH